MVIPVFAAFDRVPDTLIDTNTDEVVELAGLANQCNDLHRMASMNQFVKENRTALETESKPVTYKVITDPYAPKPITSNRSASGRL